LAHLHSRIWSSFTNDKYDLVYKNQTIRFEFEEQNRSWRF
jgi:hypothetical protein